MATSVSQGFLSCTASLLGILHLLIIAILLSEMNEQGNTQGSFHLCFPGGWWCWTLTHTCWSSITALEIHLFRASSMVMRLHAKCYRVAPCGFGVERILQIHPPVLLLSLHTADHSLCWVEVSCFGVVPFIYFCFCFLCLGEGHTKTPISWPVSRVLLLFVLLMVLYSWVR